MTLARAIELREILLETLRKPGAAIELDLSQVTELDSAGVQLLLAAKRTALAQGRELQLVGQSMAVMQVLGLLRLDSYFGEPELVFFGEDSP